MSFFGNFKVYLFDENEQIDFFAVLYRLGILVQKKRVRATCIQGRGPGVTREIQYLLLLLLKKAPCHHILENFLYILISL